MRSFFATIGKLVRRLAGRLGNPRRGRYRAPRQRTVLGWGLSSGR